MKRLFFKKYRASILLQTVIICFLFISLTLFIQLLLDNRFELYKTDRDSKELFMELDYLDQIIKQEFKLIELKINSQNVLSAEELIENDSKQQKIYINNQGKISRGGYRLYSQNLEVKLKKNFKRTFDISYVKEVKVLKRSFYIFATIEYKIGSTKELSSLYDGKLKRMWIKENVY